MSRASIISQYIFPGLRENPLPLFSGAEDLQELLAIIPSGLVGKKTRDSIKSVKACGFFKYRHQPKRKAIILVADSSGHQVGHRHGRARLG